MNEAVLSNEDPLFTLKESAKYLNLKTEKTFSVWFQRGTYANLLKPVTIGRRRFFRKSVLENFIQARTHAS